MKTIVVPTDFSGPAENAMFYAGRLAKDTGASVLLLHVYQIPVGMNDMPLLMVSAEELKRTADAGLERARELLQKQDGMPEIRIESRLGNVIDELNNVCEQENPVAIVVGKQGATGIERVLFGSTSLSIIRHTSYPVIVVPGQTAYEPVRTAALAIDAESGHVPVNEISAFINAVGARLHLIHVRQQKSESMDLRHLISELHCESTTIYDHQFVHGIETFVTEHHIDLLIILPHKHNIIERLFFKTHTPELLQKISIPIMCINKD